MYPDIASQVSHLVDLTGKPDLFYSVFLHNTSDFFGLYESLNVPFAFTLYPGGGLHLYDPQSDENLKRIGASELLKAVITTQTTTRNYIVDNGFVPEEKVHLIFGGIIDSEYFENTRIPKKKYGVDKDTFDICFVAIRYDPRGVAKGYDVFLDVARQLLEVSPAIRFHIVGDSWWDVEDEMDTSFLGDRVTHYGIRETTFFPNFHSGMDMILSPNKPFVHPRLPGGFDGFPTGCCVEAGLCGTAVLCTDLLGNNNVFEDGKDIRIIPYDLDGICDIIVRYLNDPESLYRLGENCRNSFLHVYDIEEQMSQRVKILDLEPYVQNL
jgi:glycosyltransferase involved in cell wall biosynthesis